jgi:hypothetical protein
MRPLPLGFLGLEEETAAARGSLVIFLLFDPKS